MTKPQKIHEYILNMGLDPEALGASHFNGVFDNDEGGSFYLSKETLSAYIERLNIGETWFFRQKGAYEQLVDSIIQRRVDKEKVKILSVPSSTGEEPYSIAIYLKEAGIPESRFEIFAADININAIQKAKKFQIEKFVQISSLGIEKATESNYAKSKLEGEKKIKENFKNSIILKPSIVYSVDDNFTTRFMTLLSRLPMMPLYYNGNTKFSPIHVSDLTDIILKTINGKTNALTLECIGPEIITFKEIIKKLLTSIQKKRLLIPIPYQLASLSAKILQIFPNPLLTEDQLKLLKYDNIETNNYKTNIDIGLEAKKLFENEVSKYSYNWMSGGQFSKKNKVVDLN